LHTNFAGTLSVSAEMNEPEARKKNSSEKYHFPTTRQSRSEAVKTRGASALIAAVRKKQKFGCVTVAEGPGREAQKSSALVSTAPKFVLLHQGVTGGGDDPGKHQCPYATGLIIFGTTRCRWATISRNIYKECLMVAASEARKISVSCHHSHFRATGKPQAADVVLSLSSV
jgi:hypothetical protein